MLCNEKGHIERAFLTMPRLFDVIAILDKIYENILEFKAEVHYAFLSCRFSNMRRFLSFL